MSFHTLRNVSCRRNFSTTLTTSPGLGLRHRTCTRKSATRIARHRTRCFRHECASTLVVLLHELAVDRVLYPALDQRQTDGLVHLVADHANRSQCDVLKTCSSLMTHYHPCCARIFFVHHRFDARNILRLTLAVIRWFCGPHPPVNPLLHAQVELLACAKLQQLVAQFLIRLFARKFSCVPLHYLSWKQMLS